MLFISSGEAFHNRQDDSHTLTHAAALYHLDLLQNEAESMDNMTERGGERKGGREERKRERGRERERKKGVNETVYLSYTTHKPHHKGD